MNNRPANSRHKSLVRFLESVEQSSNPCEPGDFLLWPNTPIGECLQTQIRATVGVDDREVDNPASRPFVICRLLERMLEMGDLESNFALLDVACGDARILTEIKRRFPGALVCGLDCHTGDFPSHAEAASTGVRLYGGFIQKLFVCDPPHAFDVVLMLNTYRNWRAAQLRVSENSLPETAEAWMYANSRHTVLTAASAQIERLQQVHVLETLASGEEDSQFVWIKN